MSRRDSEMTDLLIRLAENGGIGEMIVENQEELKRDEGTIIPRSRSTGGQSDRQMVEVISAVSDLRKCGFFVQDEGELARDRGVLFSRPAWFTQEDYEAITGVRAKKPDPKAEATVETSEPDGLEQVGEMLEQLMSDLDTVMNGSEAGPVRTFEWGPSKVDPVEKAEMKKIIETMHGDAEPLKCYPSMKDDPILSKHIVDPIIAPPVDEEIKEQMKHFISAIPVDLDAPPVEEESARALWRLCERFISDNGISSRSNVGGISADKARVEAFLDQLTSIVGYEIDGQFFVPRTR